MKTALLLSLVTSIIAWPAMAYEKRETVDSFRISCTLTGHGKQIHDELTGTVTHGLVKNWFNGNINENPGIYDKNYNPKGSREVRAILNRELGVNQWALGVSTDSWFGLLENQLTPAKKFPETLALKRGLTSWSNDVDSPDAYLSYDIAGVHSAAPVVTFRIEIPDTGKTYAFRGVCSQLANE